MDTFSKNKYLFWGVIILSIINIALLTTFWLNRPIHPDHIFRGLDPQGKFPDKNHILGFMIHELKLNDIQAKTFENESKTHFDKMDKLMESMKAKKEELLDIDLKQNNTEKSKLIIDEIGKLSMQIEEINLEHFKKLQTILNNEQKDKFINLLKEVFNRKGIPGMSPPPREMPKNPPMDGRPGCPPPF